MNLDQITTRGWILALFIRSDGERFLLGSGAYDFKSELQHFQPNTLANDIVELQGSDGQLIAGQVRRSAVQPFDGYIGDSTQNRDKIENYRRAFLQFFRKDFFYTTVYIYPNGEAIQRKRGYLVDAPSVPELYQIVPTYHVALNYEDPNYYEYAEDETGQEIFANIVEIALAQASAGGLIWDADGAISHAIPISTTKNLINYNLPTTEYFLNSNGTWGTSSGLVFTTQWLNIAGNTQLVVSFSQRVGTPHVRVGQYRADGSFITRSLLNTNGGTLTLNANTARIVLNTEKTNASHFENLQLEIGATATAYVEFGDPRLENGYEWEPGGTGGETTITLNAVESVRPVWSVIGPATDPTLTNITTGQTITFESTVPAGQTLIVDMDERTATMEGANVFQFINGDWLELEPGNNKLAYTASGGATDPSTLSWNGVVG